MISLNGRIALVTGASRGLGRAIALSLGKAGADVVVTDLLMEGTCEDRSKLESYSSLSAHFSGSDAVRTLQTSKEISQLGVRSTALKMDVTDFLQVNDVVNHIKDQFGAIDILVNNAGVMDNIAMMENQSPKMFQRDLNVNLTGAFNCIRSVWPNMKFQKWGRIINISSFVGLSGAFAQPGYGASKAGLIGLTKSAALEGAKSGITVNSVLPGFIATEAIKLHDSEMKERIKENIPVKRMGTPEEVAPLVSFLASDEASYMTGTAIPVTGGADLFVF